MKKEYLQPIKKEFLASDTNNMHMGLKILAKPGIFSTCLVRENAMDWPKEHKSYVHDDNLDDISIANIIKSMNHDLPDE